MCKPRPIRNPRLIQQVRKQWIASLRAIRSICRALCAASQLDICTPPLPTLGVLPYKGCVSCCSHRALLAVRFARRELTVMIQQQHPTPSKSLVDATCSARHLQADTRTTR